MLPPPPLAGNGGRGRSPSHRASSWAPPPGRSASPARYVRGCLRWDGKGAAAVGHDEILSILGLVVETVSGRLHLFPTHIRYTEGAPEGPYRFASLPVIWSEPIYAKFLLIGIEPFNQGSGFSSQISFLPLVDKALLDSGGIPP